MGVGEKGAREVTHLLQTVCLCVWRGRGGGGG